MRRIRRTTILVPLAACLLVASPAAAKPGTALYKVYKVYQSTGKVDPCKFTASELKQAKGQISPDINQYAPDFGDAIQTAIEQRASGACGKKSSSPSSSSSTAVAPAPTSGGGGSAPQVQTPQTTTQAPATSTPATTAPAPVQTTPAPAPTVDPAPAANDDAIPAAATGPIGDSSSNDAPAPLLVLAIVVGALLLVLGLAALARWMGYDPPWLGRWRHATEEAGWRASAAWSEFTDWVRLGR